MGNIWKKIVLPFEAMQRKLAASRRRSKASSLDSLNPAWDFRSGLSIHSTFSSHFFPSHWRITTYWVSRDGVEVCEWHVRDYLTITVPHWRPTHVRHHFLLFITLSTVIFPCSYLLTYPLFFLFLFYFILFFFSFHSLCFLFSIFFLYKDFSLFLFLFLFSFFSFPLSGLAKRRSKRVYGVEWVWREVWLIMGRAQDFFYSALFVRGALSFLLFWRRWFIATYYGMADLKGMYLLAVICRLCKYIRNKRTSIIIRATSCTRYHC